MTPKKFNEEFLKQYEGSSLLTKFDVEPKAHIELDPVMGDAMLQAQKVRDKMKDDFKEQDKMVDEFIKDYELEEKPKLPEVDNKKELKDMKLAESMLTEEDMKPINESFGGFAGVHDFIDECVPLEDLGLMAYKWMSSDELEDMLIANGYEKEDMYESLRDLDESFDRLVSKHILKESSIQDMINAFENKIDELEEKNESLEESVELTEDYSNFIGKPLKDFLRTIPRNTKINIDYEEPDDGCSGINGRVFDVPWSVADRIIKDIQLGDESFYKFKVFTESVAEDKKKDLTEARKVSKFSYDDDESHRYKIVAADEDAKELFVKDVKGFAKIDKVLDELTDEKLNGMGATQVYVTRDDDKEIYLKFSNEDGTWDVIQDDRDMEKPAEDRDTIFNHIIADLNAESTPDQKALRRISRKGEGYVGFENDEIGFSDDTFHLKSQSDKPISWAKKVADYYGFKTSEVKLGNNGYKYIDIYAPGVGSDPKLAP